jgi:hypothetical protein
MPKYWVKHLGADDDDAFGIVMPDESDVSDMLQSACAVFDFGGRKPSQLRVLLAGERVSNRADLADIGTRAVMEIEFREAMPAPIATPARPAAKALPVAAAASPVRLKAPVVRSISTLSPLRKAMSSFKGVSASPGASTSGPSPQRSASVGSPSRKPPVPTSVTRPSPSRAAAPPGIPAARGHIASIPVRKPAVPSPLRRPSPSGSNTGTPLRSSSVSSLRGASPTVGLHRSVALSADPSMVRGASPASRSTPSHTEANHPACRAFVSAWGTPTTCATCKQHKVLHLVGAVEKPPSRIVKRPVTRSVASPPPAAAGRAPKAPTDTGRHLPVPTRSSGAVPGRSTSITAASTSGIVAARTAVRKPSVAQSRKPTSTRHVDPGVISPSPDNEPPTKGPVPMADGAGPAEADGSTVGEEEPEAATPTVSLAEVSTERAPVDEQAVDAEE